MACRPWIFTEHHFGFFGYYRTRVSRSGADFEGFDTENLLITVLATGVVTVVCLWEYHRLTRTPQRKGPGTAVKRRS
jgi:hypothetical protein